MIYIPIILHSIVLKSKLLKINPKQFCNRRLSNMTANARTELSTEEVRMGVPQLKSPFTALIHYSFQIMIIFHPSQVLSAALLSS